MYSEIEVEKNEQKENSINLYELYILLKREGDFDNFIMYLENKKRH